MKPLLFKIPKTESEAFRVQVDDLPFFYDTIHYHPEIQLTLIQASSGTHFVGDAIGIYQPSDIYLLGSNLPHVFRSDKNGSENAKSVSVFFKADFLGETFFSIQETQNIRELLEKASRGIKIFAEYNKEIRQDIESLSSLNGFEKLLRFLKVLNQLAVSENSETLSSIAYANPQKDVDNQRINDVFEFLMNNFEKEISLEEVANIANMTPNAFCRFFKLRTRKTYTDFLNDIRIGNACKLLSNENLSIIEVSLASGFNNLSNFNRQFRRRTKQTPTEFRKLFLH